VTSIEFPAAARPDRKSRSIARLVAAVAVVLALPLAVLIGLAATIYVQAEHTRLTSFVRNNAHAVALMIDKELGVLAASAQALANHPEPTGGGLESFRVLAERAAADLGAAVVLRDAAGLPLFDSRRTPVGAARPAAAPPPGTRVTDLTLEAEGRPVFVVRAALADRGGVVEVVAEPDRIRRLLERVPAEWGSAVSDGSGLIVARWREHDRFVGRPISDEALRARVGDEGYWEGENLQGQPVLVGFARSGESGWYVASGVLRADLEAPAQRATLAAIGLGGALALVAMAITGAIALRIRRSVAALAALAREAERGSAVAPLRTGVREIDQVSAAMAEASAKLDLATDEILRASETKDWMLRELHHRGKNTLALVQSIAAATARGAASVRDFDRDFSARLASLAHTYDLLVRDPDERVDLHALVAGEFAPFGTQRLASSGPSVKLPGESAVQLGMAIHELLSNAAKHGALRGAEGSVELSWRLDERGLALDWRERSGSPVEPPSRQGFGSRLIERVLVEKLGAKVETAYRPEGLAVSIALPPAVLAAGEPPLRSTQ
jgi:two-component sensor histidine kinase